MSSYFKEKLAAAVMLPPVIEVVVENGVPEADITGSTVDEVQAYVSELDSLAFRNPRDYDGFRGFLRKHSNMLGNVSNVIRCMVDSDLDYILDRVKEERIESAAEILGNDNFY